MGAVAAQLTVPAAASITLTYPASVNLAEVPILGNGLVRLNDGVKVYPAPGASSTTVVNSAPRLVPPGESIDGVRWLCYAWSQKFG